MKLTTWSEVVARGSNPWRYAGLVALAVVTVATKYLSNTNGPEDPMHKKLSKMAQNVVAALAESIWAIMTSAVAGILLPA